MSKLKMFIPITKIDEEKRCVYGIATGETPDKSGEICDYDSSKPFYEKWSSDIEKASDGKSKGNLRVMHSNKVAGTIPQVMFNDEAKQIEICAKVIDDDEWKMVIAGGYTGFSQGGSYEKKWKDGEFMRYTSNPCEISLVDNPCLPTATFEVLKADGSVELRKFQTLEQNTMSKKTENDKDLNKSVGVVQGWQASDGSFHVSKSAAIAHNEELEKKAKESADGKDGNPDGEDKKKDKKTGDDKEDGADGKAEKRDFSDKEREKAADAGQALPDGSYPIKSKEDLKNAIQAYGRAKNKAKVKAHIITRAKALSAEDMLPAGWNGSTKSVKAELKKFSEMGFETWDVQCALDALRIIECLCMREQMEEMQGMDEAEQVKNLEMVLSGLREFIASEIMESEDDDVMEMSADGDMKKAGAKLSGATKEHLNKMYKSAQDHMGTMQECMKSMGAMDADEDDMAEKAQKAAELEKADKDALDKEEFKKNLEDKTAEVLKKFNDTIDTLQKRIGVLESLPVEAKGVKLVLKDGNGDEGGNSSSVDAILKRNSSESPQVLAYELIKAIQKK